LARSEGWAGRVMAEWLLVSEKKMGGARSSTGAASATEKRVKEERRVYANIVTDCVLL
jgi:hypothetical protein